MLARRSFLLAAVILVAGALLHIGVLAAGPEWIAFVGAPPEVVRSAELGTWLAPVSTLGIAALLAGLALYSLAAAGKFRPLPLVKPILGLFAAIFVLRGLIIVPAPVDGLVIISSLAILVLGVALCLGLWATRGLRQLPIDPRP